MRRTPRTLVSTILIYVFGLNQAVFAHYPLRPLPASAAVVVTARPLPATAPRATADLRTWTVAGADGQGRWERSSDGRSVTQTLGGTRPTLLVSPDDVVNATLRARVTVLASTNQDDFIGLAFGVRSPVATAVTPSYDLWLVDWKAKTEKADGRDANEGFTLSRIEGAPASTLSSFWAHEESPWHHVLARHQGPNTGWQRGREHSLELSVRGGRMRLRVDGATIFDVARAFTPGRFALYTYSQPQVLFRDVSVETVNGPPAADAGPDFLAGADASCRARVTLDATASTDPDGDPLTYTWTGPFGTAEGPTPSVLFPEGVNAVELTASDGTTTSRDTVVITVEDRTAPAITCPAPVKTAAPAGQCTVTGIALGTPEMSDGCGPTSASHNAPATFGVGTTGVVWSAVDAAGLRSSCTQPVIVAEGTNPEVSAILEKEWLWPPSHKLEDVGLEACARSACLGLLPLQVTVWTDEPEDSRGDGRTDPDASIENGRLLLRPERAGARDGRVYLIIVAAGEGANPTGHECLAVKVSKSPSAADVASVTTQAEAAVSHCRATGSAPRDFGRIAAATLASTPGRCGVGNERPRVDAGPDQRITLPAEVALLDGTVTDDGRPLGGALTSQWTIDSGPGTVTFADASQVDTTATFSAAGQYVLRLTAGDGELSAFDTTTITVIAQNLPPTVDAGPDQAIEWPTNTAALDGTAADDALPAGSVLATAWSKVSGPGVVTFADAAAQDTTATFGAAGEYVLRLTATDSVFTVSDEMTVRIEPTLTIDDASVLEGQDGLPVAEVVVRLSGPHQQDVHVLHGTQPQTAGAGCDYLPRTGRLTFAPGETVKTIAVPIVADLVPEPEETFQVILTEPEGATLADADAVIAIADDDLANRAPGPITHRAPADGTTALAAAPALSWSGSDADGESVTYDVFFGATFEVAGQAWRSQCPTTPGPSPRAFAASAYDAEEDRLFVFGGASIAGAANDTWMLSNATGAGGPPAWSKVAAEGGPSPRQQAVAAYDRASDRLIVHGGCAGDCTSVLGDTWILIDASGRAGVPRWQELAGTALPRYGHGAAYDAAHNRLVVFGGVSAAGDHADTWILVDANGLGSPAWKFLIDQGAPARRRNMSVAYDPAERRLLVFGGRDAHDTTFNDVWLLRHADGADGVPSWHDVSASGEPPFPRWGSALALAAAGSQLLVYGGSGPRYDTGSNFVFGDTWRLRDVDGAPAWQRLSPAGDVPPARFGAAAAYSPLVNRLVVTGGANNRTGARHGDVAVLEAALGDLPLVSAAQATTTYTPSDIGDGRRYYWRVVARDGRGARTGSAPWSLTANVPPSVDAGLPQTLVLPQEVAPLSGVASDDGQPGGLDCRWTPVVGAESLHIADPAAPATIATFGDPGHYRLRLTCSDGLGEASDDTTVDVVPANRPPEIISEPIVRADLSAPGVTEPFDLSSWTVVQYKADTEPARWTIDSTGTVATQSVNADPSVLLSDIVLSSHRVEGTWKVGPQTPFFDDDFVGFVFGYQDRHHYYLFDWKALEQNSAQGFGDRGMSVKLVDADSDLTQFDLWPTQGNGTRVRTLYHNRIGWVDQRVYRFMLQVEPGRFTITVRDGAAVLASFTIEDDTYTSGRFGFYNYSQGNVRYSGFTSASLPAASYSYDVEAVDPDADAVTYRLTAAPERMRIDASTGVVSWEARAEDLGDHAVDIEARDARGLTDTQSYLLAVRKANEAPQVDAGQNQTVGFPPGTTLLRGTVLDDRLPEGADLRLAWTQVSGPGAVSFADAAAAETAVTFETLGDYTLRLTASDSELSASDDLVVHVVDKDQVPVNRPPVVDAGPDRPLMPGARSVFVLGSVEDDGLPQGAPVSVQWSKVSGPGDVTFGLASSVGTSASVTVPGEYVLRLTASDSEHTVSDTMVVHLAPDLVVSGPDLAAVEWRDGERPENVFAPVTMGGRLRVTLSNVGAGATRRGFTISVFEDWNMSGRLEAGDDSVVGVLEHRAVLAGESVTVDIPLEGEVSFRNAVLHVFVDSTDVCAESDERNNTAHSRGVAADLPDLVASYARRLWTQDIDGRPLLALLVRIGNRGSQPAPGSFAVAFYDGDPAQRKVVKVEQTARTQPIPPGGYFDVGFDATRWGAASPLWVVADDDGTSTGVIVESDETNNAFQSALYLRSGNRAPKVTAVAQPPVLMQPETTVVLDGTVTDDGRPIDRLETAWSQESGPAPVVIADPASVDTTAAFSEPGEYRLRLQADDGEYRAWVILTVQVRPPNQPPVVDAGAPRLLQASIGALDGTVSDDGLPPDGALEVSWSKVSGPGDVQFAAPDYVDTPVRFTQSGDYVLMLTASDDLASASDTVSIHVAAANIAPVVDAGADQVLTLPTRELTLDGRVQDDGLPADRTLTRRWRILIAPGPATLAAPDQEDTAAVLSDPGTYVFELSASDGELSGADTTTVVLKTAPPEGEPPVVAITAPVVPDRPGAPVGVTAPVLVTGTAQSATLSSWRLEHGRAGDKSWTTFATGTTSVESGPLGTFDPTMLQNGLHDIRLTATDISGRSMSAQISVVVKDNFKVGLFTLSFVDLEVPVSGIPIRVTRTYDSREKRKRDFGVGWTLDVANVAVSESGALGAGWIASKSPHQYTPQYCLQPSRPQVVTVTFADGRVWEYEPVLSPQCQTFLPMDTVRISYRAVPGTTTQGRLELVGNALGTVVGAWPEDWRYTTSMDLYNEQDNFQLFDPSRYRLVMPDGTELALDQVQGLTSIRDPNGNVLTVGANGITHSSGKGVVFRRDPEGRIDRITDPAGEVIEYTYENGDLKTHKDREQNVTTFTYHPAVRHHLTEIKDPRGKTPIRNEYYEDGRIKSHTDAFGKTITYAHDIAGRQEVVTDRNGKVRVLHYDDRGNVTKEVQPDGKQVRRAFNGRNLRLTETEAHDPANSTPATTVYTYYDGTDNLKTMTDPQGNTTEQRYNSRNQVTLTKDARGHFTINDYDAATGNLLGTEVRKTEAGPALSRTTYTYFPDGNVKTQRVWSEMATNELCETQYEYFPEGHLKKEIDPLGHATEYTYDATGNRRTDTTTRTLYTCTAGATCSPSGTETLVTTYEYDKNGRLRKAIQPDGTFTETVYDALGKAKESYDALRNKTESVYDDMGQLEKLIHADLAREEYTYWPEGQRKTAKNRNGHTTSYEYDPMGRLEKTVFPDTHFTRNHYDPAGRLDHATDARGHTTIYGYFANGQREFVQAPVGTDAAPQIADTRFQFDPNGNVIKVTDANGQVTEYEYDEQNRRTKTLLPLDVDDSERLYTETTYDAAGRRIAERDPAGKVTQFRYDCAGRLVKVIDADLKETTYAYDELGNRITQTDAKGHTTAFQYDKLGRQVARILPDGATEAMTYTPVGQLDTHTTFKGDTIRFEYEPQNPTRLSKRIYPDGSHVSFTYWPAGQLRTVTDARGVTTYTYDNRDRLRTITAPEGVLEYDYDANGNRTVLKDTLPDGSTRTLVMSYDHGNRLDTITDPAAKVFDLDHDRNGNRAALKYPNGVETSYVYNARNQLRDLTSTHVPTGRVVQGYNLTLGPAGKRTRIVEASGRILDYGYDNLYRLTRETVTVGGATDYQKLFGYDDVGNRETETTTGRGAGSIVRTYDERDRLLTENGSTVYGWDSNGNLTAKLGDGITWDLDNRLTRYAKPDGTRVEHTYDHAGNRVRTSTTNAGATSATRFLVDTSGSLSHVVAETDAAGRLIAYYIRANDELIGILRPDGNGGYTAKYVHADHIGSIRALTDAAGNTTDTWTYEAFGTLINRTGTDPQPYQFAGEPYDPNIGFQYHRARWMDPRVGTFVSMDPFGGRTFDPPSLHRYLYAAADPANKVDPTGKFSVTTAAITVGIVGALAGAYLGYQSQGWRGAVSGGAGGFIAGYFLTLLVVDFAALAALGFVSTSVWMQNGLARGELIENHLAKADYSGWFRIGSTFGGKFDLVDFQKGLNLVSLKSVDTLTSGTGWRYLMQSHIRDLGTRGATVDGQAARMILDLRVPPGGAAAAQSLVGFGRTYNVTVNIQEIDFLVP